MLMGAYRVEIDETGSEGYWVLRDEFGYTAIDRECSSCNRWLSPGDDIRRMVLKIDGELIRQHIGLCCFSTHRMYR